MLRFRPEFDLDDEEDNALLAQHLDDVERGFDFLLTPHLDRRVRRLGVRHRNYVGRLMQRGGAAPLRIQQQRHILPRQMEQALQRAIRDQILQDPEVHPNDHFLININSNRLRHSYHSTRMRVREWIDNDLRAREIMQQISRMLNSNEQFRLDDSFSLHISHIRDPGRGAGHNRIRKGCMALEKLLDLKKSVIKIKNDDELCCARAIVTMKAYCDFGSRHAEYDSLRRGRPIQERQARDLHRQAGVPEGPCGLPELEAFQRHLVHHQIVVLSVDHQYQIIFKGPTQTKQIVLIKVKDHYHGCNSLSGFLGKGHYCVECETGFNDDSYGHHPCKGQKCPACHQTGCPGSRSTTPAAVVIGSSSGNSASPTTRRTRPPTDKKLTPTRKSKACAGPSRNALDAIDFFANARSRRDTSAGQPNAPRAKNTRISTSTSVSSRIPPNWSKRENC